MRNGVRDRGGGFGKTKQDVGGGHGEGVKIGAGSGDIAVGIPNGDGITSEGWDE